MKIKIIEQDMIFLSYDEPNAEKNYADLIEKFPWAKRVHGVKGSDAAHKACAALSDTEYFITVDGDNIVNPDFANVEVDLDALGLTEENVFSWCGKINVNGLMYGNGGLKMWTRKFVNEMRTHENAVPGDEKGKVEFCFDHRYYQFNENYSESIITGNPFQAWRAGFREGVKMSLNQGSKTKDLQSVWWQNYERLLIWCNIGADVNNGFFSMLGAREGAYLTNCTDWDYSQVRDFEYLTDHWDKNNWTSVDLAIEKYKWFGHQLFRNLKLEIAEFDTHASKFFKRVYHNTPRIIKRYV